MVDASSVCRLLEAFTYWDNSAKTGPWQSSYAGKPSRDPMGFANPMRFSRLYLEPEGVQWTSEIASLAPILYGVGPLYGMKLLSELDVAGFSASGIPPKGVTGKADAPSVLDRYKTLAVWSPFSDKKGVTCASAGKTLRFSSAWGCSLSLDTESLDCSFQFGDYSEPVFSHGKSDNSDTLRMVDTLIGCEGVPDSKYSAVKELLSKQLSYVTFDETFTNTIAPAVVSVLGFDEYGVFLDELSGKKLGILDEFADSSKQPAYKDGLARYLSALILPSEGCDFADILVSKDCPAPSRSDPGVFNPKALVLVPEKPERVKPYLQAMSSAFDAVYPQWAFPVLRRELENEQVKYQEANCVVQTLSQDDLKAELESKRVGFAKIDLTRTLSSMGKSDSVFTGLVDAEDEEKRILMNLVGPETDALLRGFGQQKLVFKAQVARDDDNRLVLTLKKTRYLN